MLQALFAWEMFSFTSIGHAGLRHIARLIELETCDWRHPNCSGRIHSPALDVGVLRVAGAQVENELDARPAMHNDDPVGSGGPEQGQPTKKGLSVACFARLTWRMNGTTAHYRRRPALIGFDRFLRRFLRMRLFSGALLVRTL